MNRFYQNAVIWLAFVAMIFLDAIGAVTSPPSSSPYGLNRAMRRQWGGVVAVKATVITNADATPSVINKAFLARSRVHQSRGIVTVTNGDSIASIYRFCRVRSNDMISRLEVFNATCGAGCTGDVGLYDTALNGGAVVSVQYFASAIDLNTAHLSPFDVTMEAAAGPAVVANMEKRIWECLGLAADPQKEYDVAITLAAAAAATGAVCVKVELVSAAG